MKRSPFFNDKGVKAQVLRPKRQRMCQRISPGFHRLARKGIDKVEVDILESGDAAGGISGVDLLWSMYPPHPAQHSGIEALGAHAQTINSCAMYLMQVPIFEGARIGF